MPESIRERVEELQKDWAADHRNRDLIAGEIAELLLDNAPLFAAAEENAAIVARLPKTADGVPIVPGMKVWDQRGAEYLASMEGGRWMDQPQPQVWDLVYSSRDAAESAALSSLPKERKEAP
ncbi:MAG TPA: hypothetical protein VD994_07600 [Prosthecobacter sp.]|nr:hypothetical protein [Prosthecobacter sp.]